MAMNWADERYVRVYTRDTADWLCLSFLAQGLLCLLFRKVDRAGVLDLGKAGRKAVAIAIGHAHQWSMLEGALDELLADGCVEIRGDLLVIPNFMEAQEAEASDKARSQKYREKRRDLARAGVTLNPKDANPVTLPTRDVAHPSRDVAGPSRETETATSRDATVTPNHAVPSVPSEPINNTHTPATPREQGAADRLALLAPKPRTHELLVELDRRGFECRPPAKASAAMDAEKVLGSIPVSVAADRVMAVVEADRAMSVIPRATLGWYLDAIRGQPEGGRRAGKQSNPQTGVAAPADASAFGEGGQRAIE